MPTIFLVLCTISFLGVSHAAGYRMQRQDFQNPAIKHVPLTGLACLFGALGSSTLAYLTLLLPPLTEQQELLLLLGSGGLGLGMLGVWLPIYITREAIANQPTETEHVRILRTQLRFYRSQRSQLRQDQEAKDADAWKRLQEQWQKEMLRFEEVNRDAAHTE